MALMHHLDTPGLEMVGHIGSVVTDTDASFGKPGIRYTLIKTFHYPFCLFYLLTKGNIKKEKYFLMLGYSSSGFLSEYFAHFPIAHSSMPMFACVYSYISEPTHTQVCAVVCRCVVCMQKHISFCTYACVHRGVHVCVDVLSMFMCMPAAMNV